MNLTANNWHTDYQAKVKSMTTESLQYVRQDAYQAAVAGESIGNPKTSQYWDEYHYCSMELKRRGATY